MKEVLTTIVREQKQIEFINDCGVNADCDELSKAIIWYQRNPTARLKHIYMHGRYPAVSIHSEKVHVHRILMMYWLKTRSLNGYSVHHINEDKMDSRKANLSVVPSSFHNSMHNAGRHPSDQCREALIRFNQSRKGTKQPLKRPDVTINDVAMLSEGGYSIREIAKMLGCGRDTVKSRIHDNPELLEDTPCTE